MMDRFDRFRPQPHMYLTQSPCAETSQTKGPYGKHPNYYLTKTKNDPNKSVSSNKESNGVVGFEDNSTVL